MIRANLPTFGAIPVAMFLAVWAVVHWFFKRDLAAKDAQIAGKTAQIELQDRQIADYKEKLQGATPDQAKARIEELEARLEARLTRLEPRTLTIEQRRTLVETARIPPGQPRYGLVISHEGGCPDCPVYAAAFERALQDAGWHVINGMIMGPSQRPSTGVGPGGSRPSTAIIWKPLHCACLRAAGIDVELITLPTFQTLPALWITARAL